MSGFSLATAAAIAALSCSSALSCDRHIYNNSSCTWTFSANTKAGNVWFDPNFECATSPPPVICNAENGPCPIPPDCTATIQYTTTAGISSGTINITDRNRYTKSWTYSGAFDDCPIIKHEEPNTGAVSLNDPANGDYSIGQCTW